MIKYKSFLNVLKSCLRWRPVEVVDIKNFYKDDEYQKLKSLFKGQPLILIDPTDKKRNTCAALSSRNFFKFKKVADDFLLNPNESFFTERKVQPLTEKELILYQMRRRTELILLFFKSPDVVPDILWPQLRRFGERLQSILEEKKYEFRVLGRDVYADEREVAVVLLERKMRLNEHGIRRIELVIQS